MSYWTHILGIVDVVPFGRTQAEKTFVLESVLNHLPKVTGSEEDMSIGVTLGRGMTIWSSEDEFGYRSNLISEWGSETQGHYLLTLHGHLRDRVLEETLREFMKWMTRLAKRVSVEGYSINIQSDDRLKDFVMSSWRRYDDPFYRMYRRPWESDAWYKRIVHEGNWLWWRED